jgi:hypothetical protein
MANSNLAYISVAPDPIGIGQSAYVLMWLDKTNPTVDAQYGDRCGNFTMTITKPDGTTSTEGPFTGDLVSAHTTMFTPDQTGNYTFVFKFGGWTISAANPRPIGTQRPAGTVNVAYVGDYFMPSTSKPVTLVVQEEPIQSYPTNPLPTSYWSRPIFQSGNLGWYQISGNWLGIQSNKPHTYNPVPTTSHIAWTRPLDGLLGGVTGGKLGGNEVTSSYFSQSHHEYYFAPPLIINGILYYPSTSQTEYPPESWIAADLRTGETLWTLEQSSPGSAPYLSNGQIFTTVTMNGYGAHAYIWGISGSNYTAYNPMSGQKVFDIINADLGTLTEDENGNLISYYINKTDNTLRYWNSTDCVFNFEAQTSSHREGRGPWEPDPGWVIDWEYGLSHSVKQGGDFSEMAPNILGTIATSISGNPIDLGITQVDINYNDVDSSNVILMTYARTAWQSWETGWRVDAAYDATTGAQLWITNRTQTSFAHIEVLTSGHGMYAEEDYENTEFTVYSMRTGEKLWGPVAIPAANNFDIFTSSAEFAYGELITAGFGGDVTAFNATNGNVLWTWTTGESGLESPYGVWPLWMTVGMTVAGTSTTGTVLVGGGHMYNPPIFQGSKLWAINATSGELEWSTLSYCVNTPAIVSDGYVVAFNSYDNQIYTFGKGPTAATVSIQNDVITHGNTVLIKGMVTDESAGTKDSDRLARFPNGVPAISDEDMDPWMGYVYQQQPKPTNATGVKVVLTVLDPNNNCYDVATTTSDENGFYSAVFTPPVPGKYTVYATFEGSESYWPSTAVTALNVLEVPQATPAPTPTPAPMTDTYVLGLGAGAIIAIIAIGLVIILMLRKR